MNPASLPTGRRGQALAVGLTILALALLWLAVGAPLLSLYQDGAQQLEQRQALLTRMEALAQSLPALTEAGRQPTDSGEALLSGNSDTIAAAGLQEAVQRMAAAAGTSLTAVETLPAEADGRWHRISLRITLTAPWPALVALLRQVDTAPAHIFIDELHFHSPIVLVRPTAMPIQASMILYGFRSAE